MLINEWSYTSTPPACLHIVEREEFNFTIYPFFFLYSSFLPFPVSSITSFLLVSDLPLSLVILRHSSPHIYACDCSLSLVSFLPQDSVCFFRLTSRYTDLDLAKRKQFMSLCKQCSRPLLRETSLNKFRVH